MNINDNLENIGKNLESIELIPNRSFGERLGQESSGISACAAFELLKDYSEEIFEYLYSIEPQKKVKHGYIKLQKDINEKMRGILIDWLIEVHMKFKLAGETLYLTVNILDKYLETVPLTRNKLQLLGVSAMLIASKYEDIYYPQINDFVYITDKAYTRNDIILMEISILKTLRFNISFPTAYTFFQIYSELIKSNHKHYCLGNYLIELTLTDYNMTRYTSSLIAASAVYLTHKVFQLSPEWPGALLKNLPYQENELKTCSKDICILFQKARKFDLKSTRKKFLLPQYCKVASMTLM